MSSVSISQTQVKPTVALNVLSDREENLQILHCCSHGPLRRCKSDMGRCCLCCFAIPVWTLLKYLLSSLSQCFAFVFVIHTLCVAKVTAEEVAKISRDEVLAFYNEYIAANAPKRRKISSRVVGTDAGKPPKESTVRQLSVRVVSVTLVSAVCSRAPYIRALGFRRERGR